MKIIVINSSMAKYLRIIRANAGVRAKYDKRLTSAVDAMHASIAKWLVAAYRQNPSRIPLAQDISPVDILKRALDRLRKRWLTKFDELGPKIAEAFVTGSARHVDTAFMATLRDAGFTVRFKSTPGINDALRAAVVENVSLIRSIPSKHFDDIEGFVMRSVQAGRDVAALTRDLESRYEITRRRAAFIARDQNNKATAMIEKVRRLELGIKTAEWVHSGGGKHPRPSHVSFSGKSFVVAKGARIDDENIQPGEKINCRCTSRVRIDALPLTG